MTSYEIQNMFTYHAPTPDQVQRYKGIREAAKFLAFTIHDACPESREKEASILLLQQAVMMANASIAVNEKDLTQEIGAQLKRVVENDPDFTLNSSVDSAEIQMKATAEAKAMIERQKSSQEG